MSQYAHLFTNPTGAGDARPTALQIISDEKLVGCLRDHVFLITGVSSGIGIETLRALHATGAHVFGTVRNLAKGQKVVDEIIASTDAATAGKITLIDMDLEDVDSVRRGAKEFLGMSDKLNVLVCNAGIMAVPLRHTSSGFESQFGTCHLAHFLLFELLKPTLLSTATTTNPSRVVSVSSIGHRCAPPQLNDPNYHQDPSKYDPWAAYGQAKTANIWFANAITRKYGNATSNLYGLSLHPGGIWTGLQDHLTDMRNADLGPEVLTRMMDAPQGAATTVYAAVSAEWKGKGGAYLANLVPQAQRMDMDPMSLVDLGYAEWAFGNEEGEERLWEISLDLVGLQEGK